MIHCCADVHNFLAIDSIRFQCNGITMVGPGGGFYPLPILFVHGVVPWTDLTLRKTHHFCNNKNLLIWSVYLPDFFTVQNEGDPKTFG